MSWLASQSSAWYQAMTLKERIASLHAMAPSVSDSASHTARAQQRLARWKLQAPFTDQQLFSQRLAMDGLNESSLLILLGEPIEAVRDRCADSPAWMAECLPLFLNEQSSPSLPHPKGVTHTDMMGFLYVIAPLIQKSRERLRTGLQQLIETYPAAPFDLDDLEPTLASNLPVQLIWMVNRAMVLELHIARMQGLLQGATPEQRLLHFFERLQQKDTALAILQDYPVLLRQLVIMLNRWVAYMLSFLQHLCHDWAALKMAFCPDQDLGRLVDVDEGMGDKHRGGQSVLILRFASGFQVVYKPKSLAMDVHVQNLLTWLNERGDHPPFRTLKILDRGAYGWVEYVSAHPCASDEEIRRFYIRQGGYLALLYAIEATDFHCENLIASGEHPVLVDLETLFQPHVAHIDTTAMQQANDELSYSVLRIGLLPQRTWSNAESAGIDMSGLGAAAGQLSPYAVPRWEALGTDEIHLIHKRIPLSGGHNRPSLNGTDVNAQDYIGAIVSGFEGIYRLLLSSREALLADDGPLNLFATDETRFLLRQTQTYSVLLHDSFHPDLLQNALDRDRFFDQLWIDIEYAPYLARVIPAEIHDLQHGDIPMFTTRPDSCHIWSSTQEQIDDFFDISGLDRVRLRLQQLSENDLKKQDWFIRASLATLTIGEGGVERMPRRIAMPQAGVAPEQFLSAARAIGDRLEQLALGSDECASWIGLSCSADGYWSLVSSGVDLYSGIPGIALFLAHLGALTEEARYTTLAQSALATLRLQVKQNQSWLSSIGAFDGWGGVIYTLTHLGMLWDRHELLTEATAIVDRLSDDIERDQHYDLMSGTAGCIGSLISLNHCAPSPRIRDIATQCGDWLIACAQPMQRGLGWPFSSPSKRPLAGFSHGAAGIAWALLKLAAITAEPRFSKAALSALDYERSLYSVDAGNWLDLRYDDDQSDQTHQLPKFMTAWCHGAPGIGLARLETLPYLDDEIVRGEIDSALRTTLREGFGYNHGLCHGDLGNLELLMQASQTPAYSEWQSHRDRVAAHILESIKQDGWLCGNPLRVESPGLMTGLAGMGYALLRLAAPTLVPSVLALAPPTCR